MLNQKFMDFREHLVLGHFTDDVKQDFDTLLSMFPHSPYKLIATDTVCDGHDDIVIIMT